MSTKFKISVEIVNDEKQTIQPIIIEKEIPSLEDFMKGENFRKNFDDYEKAVLMARKEAVEVATKQYLEEASKKKLKTRNEGSSEKETLDMVENGYSIEAEIGLISINTCRLKKGSRVVYDTRQDIFPYKVNREKYRSICFDDLMLYLPCVDSYRVSEKILNRVRWQQEDNGIKHRTIANIIEKEGTQIAECIENKVTDILTSNGFNKNGTIKNKDILTNNDNIENHFIDEDNVINALENYNDGKTKELQIELSELHESFENPKLSVNASIDDVGAKKQKKSGRSKYSEHKRKGTRQFVKNTVLHIQNNKNSYIVNAPTILQTLKWLIAFLLYNKLVNKGVLVFFVDGADDLRRGIQKLFGWVNYKIILDWYHLKKKCEQRLSLSIRGSVNRNMVLDEILAYLWVGKIDAAVAYLRALDIEIVKDAEHIEKLVAYFDRNWSYIPCYALRKCLGLRNSSNRGEKSNHLVVSDRQKKNGMSWSKCGSVSLATVTTLHLNNEKDNWIRNRTIEFKFCDKKCA